MSLDDLCSYLDASPSPFHAVANASDRLGAAGFTEMTTAATGPIFASAGFVRRDGGLIAWRTPDGVGPERRSGSSVHTPIRPASASSRARISRTSAGSSSTSRCTAASSTTRGSTATSVSPVGSRCPTVHTCPRRRRSAGGTSTAARRPPGPRGQRRGPQARPQQHLRPVWGVGLSTDPVSSPRGSPTSPAATCRSSWELCLYDTQPAAVIGGDRSMLASGRLDNLLSCWAAWKRSCRPIHTTRSR